MTKRVNHCCGNCRHQRIDYLTTMPTWWCESPRRKGNRFIGYSQKERCRYFEPLDEEVER